MGLYFLPTKKQYYDYYFLFSTRCFHGMLRNAALWAEAAKSSVAVHPK